LSYRVVEWVMENAPRHGGGPRACLIAIAWHTDDEGRGARPGHQLIAKRAGCAPRTVRDHLAVLEREGSIAREGYHPGGGTVIWRVVMAGTPEQRKALADLRDGRALDPADLAGPGERQIPPDPERSGGSRRTADGPAKPAGRSGKPRRSGPAGSADDTSDSTSTETPNSSNDAVISLFDLDAARADRPANTKKKKTG